MTDDTSENPLKNKLEISANAPKDWRETLNLPQTGFPMRADLPKREPAMLAEWEAQGIYEKIIEKNEKSAESFILHDGPPYANGSIHFGHILNKVLKDIIIKHQNLSGVRAEYIPGWDCHGLPIELGVDKKLDKKKRDMSPAEIRRECRKYASDFIDIQRKDFKRLGIFGRWEKPYLTMNADYEATIAREIGKIYQNGFLKKGYKPVHWCSSCATALAEAEVEYETKTSPSIYVLFKAPETLKSILNLDRDLYFTIWTTTPWTLPANVAIAVGEKFTYAVVAYQDKALIIAKDLIADLEKQLHTSLPILKEILGDVLAAHSPVIEAEHPFLPRTSRIVAGHHVTLESGTGLVHIAPGHGMDDYKIGLQYKLDTLVPVDARGRFTADVGIPEWEKQPIFQANDLIIDHLKASDRLLFTEPLSHSYPHCWRCKKPVIFRATEQWFILLDEKASPSPQPSPIKGEGAIFPSPLVGEGQGEGETVRARALYAIDHDVEWIPDWGRNRIHSMVRDRPDWCVSRQRLWGVPIPAFYCENDHLLFTPEITEHIAKQFEEATSDVWYEKSEIELLPVGTRCAECGSTAFRKDPNILDVWFDSGVSHAAVVDKEFGPGTQADLYLEGSDQHRGWFHSSLLTAVATKGKAPYKAVLTHGFVVDEHGKKYSKSAGNYIPPEKILNEMGADLLRLWVASEDYRNDIRVSKNRFEQLGEAYRKIRNTCRFLLGNLDDFNRDRDYIAPSDRVDIDQYAILQLQTLTEQVNAAYHQYEFHRVYYLINEYCVVALSAEYLDILKDRLYTFKKDGRERRSAQSTLFDIVEALARLLAPLIPFTAEDIWQHVPHYSSKAKSVFLNPPIYSSPWDKGRLGGVTPIEEYKNSADFSLKVTPPTPLLSQEGELKHALNEQYCPSPPLEKGDQGGFDVFTARFKEIFKFRDEVLKALELARKDKLIAHSLEAKVLLTSSNAALSRDEDWPSLFITSQVEWTTDIADPTYVSDVYTGLKIKIVRADGEKCPRCWNYATTIGKDRRHPAICHRCAAAVD